MLITDVVKIADADIVPVLEKLPNDEVYSSREIVALTGCSSAQVKRLSFVLTQHAVKQKRITYWGSKIAIKNLKKHLKI